MFEIKRTFLVTLRNLRSRNTYIVDDICDYYGISYYDVSDSYLRISETKMGLFIIECHLKTNFLLIDGDHEMYPIIKTLVDKSTGIN